MSVSNKNGLAEFVGPLAERGLRVVSTGGTAKLLRASGTKVVEVAEQTGFPEAMDGRVRTLHPRIHMALLARGRDPADMALLREHKLEPFDLVVVNLYPFAQSLADGLKGDELIDEIDIGGPALLRAAAKSFDRIAVVCEPEDYAWIGQRLASGGAISLDERRALAAKVFAHASRYDALIASTLSADAGKESMAEILPDRLSGAIAAQLRYGENPHQQAWWMKSTGNLASAPGAGLHDAEILHGKPLSYNNILDIDAAVATCREFAETAAVAVKHGNPCGVGVGKSVEQAVLAALKADPVSVFGGVVACNRKIDLSAAQALSKIFLECVVAPDFDAEALAQLQRKKDIRLLRWPEMAKVVASLEFRTVAGGYLAQRPDSVSPWSDAWRVIGERPNLAVRADLELAWKVCAHLKSNAIAIASQGRTIGLGMGQVNRVDAVEQAIERMRRHAPGAPEPVLASDAFFPFADSIELAAKAGIRWIIQPGGSIRDEETIARAIELGVNMLLTGSRHFRH